MTESTSSETLSPDRDQEPDAGSAQVVIFSPWGLAVIFAVLLVATWLRQWALTVFAGALLASGGVSYLWSKLALTRIGYGRSLSESRCFPDDTIQAHYEVENRKLLPLPWVEVRDTIPFVNESGPNGGTAAINRKDEPSLVFNGALLWYRKARWSAPIKPTRRGLYVLGPSTLTTGDIFGFFPRSRTFDDKDYLVVYPRLYRLEELELPSRFPLGETRASTRLFEDPTRTIGLREYVPGASFRHIHWKASARRQTLQVKVFEPTTTLQVSLFLDVDGLVTEGGPIDDEKFERAVSVAASLANHLIDRRTAVGLFVNANQVFGGGPVLEPPASGVDHLVILMERLARITAVRSHRFEKFFDIAFARSLAQGSTLLLATAGFSDVMTARLRELHEKGVKIVICDLEPGADDQGRFAGLETMAGPIPVWSHSRGANVGA